ncbi:MAG: ribonuclease HII [Armatimonadota bacterium]
MPGLWTTEVELRQRGFVHIAGVDEAGCGPIAGPVVAAAVVFAGRHRLPGLADSKLTSQADRERLFALIQQKAVSVGVGIVDARSVDRLNILAAARRAMIEAIERLDPRPDLLLVDGRGVPGAAMPQRAIVKGDRSCACIAAASIVAKVTRDRLMVELDVRYPGYGFSRHKGYGTREHLERLAELGPCPEHRLSFAPVRDVRQVRLLLERGDGHAP